MGRDAVIADAQYGMGTVEPLEGGAAGTGLPFVARRRRVVEIRAVRPLEQVTADGGHVAELGRRAGQNGFREERIPALDFFMVGHIRVRGEGAETESTVCPGFDLGEGQVGDVDQPAVPGCFQPVMLGDE